MRFQTKKLLFAAMFAAVTTICAQIVIPVPFSQVQFSMAVVAVFLCGGLLGVKYGCISMLVYILLGACGMPVFGKFMGGIGVLFGPTGGYIVAYPLMTCAIGLIARGGRRGFVPLFLSMLVSLIICYIFGSTWLSIGAKISFSAAIMTGVVPFVVFDIIKAALAAYLCVIMSKQLRLGNNSQ